MVVVSSDTEKIDGGEFLENFIIGLVEANCVVIGTGQGTSLIVRQYNKALEMEVKIFLERVFKKFKKI